MKYWLIAERFNQSNHATFQRLLAAGRLNNIGHCTRTGKTPMCTAEQAEMAIAFGNNIYADVGFETCGLHWNYEEEKSIQN